MEQIDQRYLVQQNKISDGETKPPVFAKVMRSKEGVFEGVSFIKSKDKASDPDHRRCQPGHQMGHQQEAERA